jgi:hypothetical protein
MASRALPHWTIKSLDTRGTAIEKRTTRIIQKTQLSSNYYWRPRTEKSEVRGNRVLLGLRKITGTRQLKADHPLTFKAAKTKMYPKIQR